MSDETISATFVDVNTGQLVSRELTEQELQDLKNLQSIDVFLTGSSNE